MKRRLFLSGSAAAALGLVGCGGGGGGAGATDIATGGVLTGTAGLGGGAGSSLPAKILACYYTAFATGGYRISDVPAEFNVVYLFHAKPNGDGSFRFEHYGEVPAADIQACRQRGQKVILTVGGAGAGFNFSNRGQSQNFIASFQEMHSRLGGLDGCDFNNFEANVGSSPEEMIWISQQLKALYGADFAITAPPQPNSAEDRAMLKAMSDAGVLSWAAPQFYDWSGFNEPGFIANRTRDWVNDLGAEKVVLGLGANYSNGPSLQDCVREWDAVKIAHPNIRGMFCWSAQHNLQGGNVWGSTMKGML
jgi:chitinase